MTKVMTRVPNQINMHKIISKDASDIKYFVRNSSLSCMVIETAAVGRLMQRTGV